MARHDYIVIFILMMPLLISACALGGAWRCPADDSVVNAAADPAFFSSPIPNFTASLATLKDDRFLLTFPSAFPSGHPDNDKVIGHYYRPPLEENRFPFVILLHGYGEKRSSKETDLAKTFRRQGYAVLLLTLPYHFERSPDGAPPGKYMMVTEPDNTVAFYKQAVMDVRRALDWAASRPEIDKKRMAVVGVSLGAMVGNLALGVDERLKAGVSVVGGADPAKFVWGSLLMGNIRHEYQQKGYTEEQLEKLWAGINSANYLRARSKGGVTPPLLMINGRWDYVMPYECTESLACAAPGAKMVWLWSGHWGPLVFREKTEREIVEFLKEAIGSRQ